jgi:hypothetical protein
MASRTSTTGTGKTLHRWQFYRSGGFDQVRLECGADLAALDQLDQKLWAALGCPTQGLEIDPQTLVLIDTDKDGRIRVPEILAAVRWVCTVLKNPDDLLHGASTLALSAINDRTAAGAQLLAAARQLLTNLGKGDAEVLTLEDTTDPQKIFAQAKFNGDGIISVLAAEDDATQHVMQDIMACLDAAQDRSGSPGISLDMVETFFTEAQAYSMWWAQAEHAQDQILVLGEATATAADALEVVIDKVEDYFTRCRVVMYDPRTAELLNPALSQYEALAPKPFAADDLMLLPLARIEAGQPLPLMDGLNPAWAPAMAQFRTEVVQPLLGKKDSLSAAEWDTLKSTFVPYHAWLQRKAGARVEQLGLPRVRALLAGQEKATLSALIAQDTALEPAAQAMAAVEQLMRYHRDLCTLLNNFVTFRDFYTPGKDAIFQAGWLYLDGRRCELCVWVDDVAAHSHLANWSHTYLVYCDCTHKGRDAKMTIAAAFTNGDANNLMVGRNGIFYDRTGQDWDATVVKILEHPISVREAFWSPYRRLARLVTEQVERMAVAHDHAAATQATETGTAPVAQPFDAGKFAGIFAAIGLALGAIGTAIAAVVTGFLGLTWWQMLLAPLGLIAVISGPSMLVAYLKLRQRNLAPILDANGWAVNTRAKINIPFGVSLTEMAQLPSGAQRSLQDPFAAQRRPWKR